MAVSREKIYLKQKMERISVIKIVKEHTGFHYLLTKIKLYSLILLELNIFHKKYQTK